MPQHPSPIADTPIPPLPSRLRRMSPCLPCLPTGRAAGRAPATSIIRFRDGSLGPIAVLRRQNPGEAPVLGIDFLDDHVRVLGPLPEHPLEGLRDLGDDLPLLLRRHAV